MSRPYVTTPRGTVIQTKTKNGKITSKLVWNKSFVPKHNGHYTRAQKFVDSEVLRYSEPFTPLRTSMLIKTGKLGTVIGEGKVIWLAPYARKRYYTPRKPGTATGPLRGPFWFERMKAVHGRTIIIGAKKMAGGKK